MVSKQSHQPTAGEQHKPNQNERRILVLYRVENSGVRKDSLFNAFSFTCDSASGPTLALIKKNCTALHLIGNNNNNNKGPDAFHWRVCEKTAAATSGCVCCWWDILDEHALLPVMRMPPSQIGELFSPLPAEVIREEGHHNNNTQNSSATGQATGASRRGIFQAVASVLMSSSVTAAGLSSSSSSEDNHLQHKENMIAVVAFKLLDLEKVNRDFCAKPSPPKWGTGSHHSASRKDSNLGADLADVLSLAQEPQQPEVDLMSFSPQLSENRKQFPPQTTVSDTPAAPHQPEPPVWSQNDGAPTNSDDISSATTNYNATNSNRSHPPNTPKESLSEKIQKAGDEAIAAIRAREAAAVKARQEEEEARQKLELKIKAWSEEHGQKKDIRALLGTLHLILWTDSGWDPVSIGDLLTDSKIKKAYFRASRLIHEDRTRELNAEQRFLAKRVFDALTQARSDHENASV